MPQLLASEIPDRLQTFLHEVCRLPRDAFHPLPPASLPEPARRLLVHDQDMTSTLASFHESPLRVEILRTCAEDGFYAREVFLRTTATGALTEYGVIAIELDQFDAGQQAAIAGGVAPLGALLHRFRIAFVSSPIGFFGIPAAALANTPLHPVGVRICYGRFNRLSRPTGETLAWILEILPPSG